VSISGAIGSSLGDSEVRSPRTLTRRSTTTPFSSSQPPKTTAKSIQWSEKTNRSAPKSISCLRRASLTSDILLPRPRVSLCRRRRLRRPRRRLSPREPYFYPIFGLLGPILGRRSLSLASEFLLERPPVALSLQRRLRRPRRRQMMSGQDR
jgi:hypothetical protein